MPNHVTNRLQVSGDRAEILRMLEEIKQEEAGIGSVDFDKVIPRPRSLEIPWGFSTSRCMELYLTSINPAAIWYPGDKAEPGEFGRIMACLGNKNYGLKECLSPEKTEETEKQVIQQGKFSCRKEMESMGRKAVTNVLLHGAVTWFDWSLEHWGSKQNSYGYEGIDQVAAKEGKLVFYTAGACADKIVQKLSEQYPALFFSYQWADEDFGSYVGEKEYEAGAEVFCNIPTRGSNEAFAMAADILGLSPEECGYRMDEKEGIYVYQ